MKSLPHFAAEPDHLPYILGSQWLTLFTDCVQKVHLWPGKQFSHFPAHVPLDSGGTCDQEEHGDADGTNAPHQSNSWGAVSTWEHIGNNVPMALNPSPFKSTRTNIWSEVVVMAALTRTRSPAIIRHSVNGIGHLACAQGCKEGLAFAFITINKWTFKNFK